ncbi:MAG: patatin-like phospholipase family protein, partial [Acidimicrobiales bacterium]
VTADAIMASAAVPTLFRTARAEHNGEEHLYWDGLFSQNPPVRDLPDARPDQIWVLQINPTKRGTEPEDMGAIRDRRNELAGNLSLRQEMHFIEKINKIVRGCRKEKGIAVDASWEMLEIDREQNPRTRSYKEIELFCIEIPEEAAGLRLDTESKLDRDPRFIRKLFDTGAKEAGTFLDRLNGKCEAAGPDYRWKDDD